MIIDVNKTMVVLDDNRALARARYIPVMRGWMLKAMAGFEWIDPRAHIPNAFHIVDRRFMFVKDKREARKILMSLERKP